MQAGSKARPAENNYATLVQGGAYVRRVTEQQELVIDRGAKTKPTGRILLPPAAVSAPTLGEPSLGLFRLAGRAG